MWRFMATLLVLGFASSVPQFDFPEANFGYLPPVPSEPECKVAPITSIQYQTSVRYSTAIRTLNRDNTQYVTSTSIREQVVPTTIYRTRIQTRIQYSTSVIQQTTVRVIDRAVTQTIPSPPRQETRYVTSTQVVPQVSYVTQTQVQTQVVPVEITNTQTRTVTRPVTSYTTEIERETSVRRVPGPTVQRTFLQTLRQTSVVRRQDIPNTRYITNTVSRRVVETTYVRGRNVFSTSYVQREQVVPITRANTQYRTTYTTREQVVTRTSVQTETQTRTQVVPQEVVQTQVVPTTIRTTIYRTRVQPFTQTEINVQTRYNTPNPVIRTEQELRTSVVQRPGQDRVVTQRVEQTQIRQQVVYQTVNRPQQVTVTETVTGPCAYNYDRPAIPFVF